MEEKEVKKKSTKKKESNKEETEKKESSKRKATRKSEVKVEKEEHKEKVVEKQSGFNTLEVIIIMFITLCFGGLLGSALTYAVENKDEIITSVPEELNEFIKTYEDITGNYYEEIDTDKLLNAGIEGMLKFLGDKYSVYMDEDATEDFNEQVEGKYVGIGSEIQRLEDGTTIISDPFEDGPAMIAGLQKGDIILKVDGEDVTEWDLEKISNKVKGRSGSSVKITVQREEEILEIPVIRKEVEITSVISKIVEKNNKKVGYIDIDIFASNSAKQFEKELLSLEANQIDSLVIDVRSNSGGYLSTAKDIASLFLEKGKTIYRLDTKGDVEIIKDTTKVSRNYPVIVLTDYASASASEILTAAIKESYPTFEIVGTHTYGKGTVQKAYQLESGATVKYTIQKWLTPNGNWIDKTGVEPTIKVELNEAYFENRIEENDNQYQEAIRIASEK